jgi:hypothetical protein
MYPSHLNYLNNRAVINWEVHNNNNDNSNNKYLILSISESLHQYLNYGVIKYE